MPVTVTGAAPLPAGVPVLSPGPPLLSSVSVCRGRPACAGTASRESRLQDCLPFHHPAHLTGPSVPLWLFFSSGVMSQSQSRDEDRDPDLFQGLCLPLRAVLRPPSLLRRAVWRTATRCLQSSLGVLAPDPGGLMGTRGSQAGHVGKNSLGLVKACALDKQGLGPGAEKCVAAGEAGPPGPEWLCCRCSPGQCSLGQCSPGRMLTR